MLPTLIRRSGGRFPYAKETWFSSGGYWVQPKNWLSNTIIASLGIAGLSYGIFLFSAEHEWRHNAPHRWIPSMLWAKQFRTGELTMIDYEAGPPKGWRLPGAIQSFPNGPIGSKEEAEKDHH